MEFCGMKREIDRKCLIHAHVYANAQSFDRCEQGSTLTGVLLLNMNFSYSMRATGSNFLPCSKYLEETGLGFSSCSANVGWFLCRFEIK